MRRIDCVPAVATADGDHVDRRRLLLHRHGSATETSPCAGLCRRPERTSRVVTGSDESAGRARRSCTPRSRPRGRSDLVAQPEERVLDARGGPGSRVQPSDGDLVARDGDVERVVGEPAVELRPLELAFAVLECLLQAHPDGIERHPCLTVPHLAERRLQLALAAQGSRVRRCQLVERARIGKTPQSRARVLLPVHKANSAPSGDTAALLGRQHQARGRTRLRPGWSAWARARVDSGAA